MDITKGIFKDYPNSIEESKLYDLNFAYFEAVKKRIQDDNQVSQDLIQCMERLQLEDFNDKFKLIEKTYPTYNVFIPFQLEDVNHLENYQFPTKRSPQEIWGAYCGLMEIENRFERKQEIKKLRPELMQYVTKIPQSKYTPPDGKEDNYLIYDKDWQIQYDLEKGYKDTPKTVVVCC